jgi:hypothetical protein
LCLTLREVLVSLGPGDLMSLEVLDLGAEPRGVVRNELN